MHKVKSGTLLVGSRVKHATDPKLDEGVIVWKHVEIASATLSKMKNKNWSVHWSSGVRGIYGTDELHKIQPKNIKDLVAKEIESEASIDKKLEDDSENE